MKEKVIKGLECCLSAKCNQCPYYRTTAAFDCDVCLMKDALELIKECYKYGEYMR